MIKACQPARSIVRTRRGLELRFFGFQKKSLVLPRDKHKESSYPPAPSLEHLNLLFRTKRPNGAVDFSDGLDRISFPDEYLAVWQLMIASMRREALYDDRVATKKNGSKRYISVPNGTLARVQKSLLGKLDDADFVHESAFAYVPGRSAVQAAAIHGQARWLVKLDIKDFFHTIDNRRVYQELRRRGVLKFQAFLISTLATRTPLIGDAAFDSLPRKYRSRVWTSKGDRLAYYNVFQQMIDRANAAVEKLNLHEKSVKDEAYLYGSFRLDQDEARDLAEAVRRIQADVKFLDLSETAPIRRVLAYLPQGAPTSGALANLVCYRMDCDFEKMASQLGLIYSRYADDITFSSSGDFSREFAERVLRDGIQVLRRNGFIANTEKTRVVPPGARLRVLGLLVGHPGLRLDRSFKSKVERELYLIAKFGFLASRIGLGEDEDQEPSSIANRLLGKLVWANQIEPDWAQLRISKLRTLYEQAE